MDEDLEDSFKTLREAFRDRRRHRVKVAIATVVGFFLVCCMSVGWLYYQTRLAPDSLGVAVDRFEASMKDLTDAIEERARRAEELRNQVEEQHYAED